MSLAPPSSNPSPQDAVIGFHPAGRSWVSQGGTATGVEPLPKLKGVLLASPQARAEVADDFGHMVSRLPLAVLRPQSADDIAQMIRFARQHRLKIGPRGNGHVINGQSQVEAGIVIDMRSLNTVHAVSEDRIDVDAGILWSVVVERALAIHRTPPVLTDLLELTVGGTLSVGGLSGNTFRDGLQIDHVLELQVVTGEGELVHCSPTQNKDLFEAVLAGLGQCGVITRATLKLVEAPTHVRLYDLGYPSLEAQLRDQRLAVENERIDYVLGFALPERSGTGWMHRMQVVQYYKEPSRPDDAQVLKGLSYQQGSESISDLPYTTWVSRLAPQLAELRQNGMYSLPHPWSDLFVPDSKLDAFAAEVLREVSPTEVDFYFPVLFYLLKRSRITRPLFSLPPGEDISFLFGVLRTAAPGAKRSVPQMVQHNRELYERNRKWEGTHYAHAALTLSPEEWRARFGPAWENLAAAKRRYDPDTVLTPGPGMFR